MRCFLGLHRWRVRVFGGMLDITRATGSSRVVVGYICKKEGCEAILHEELWCPLSQETRI